MSEAVTLHVYSANHQPATRFTVHIGDGIQKTFQYRRRQCARAECCNRMRWLAYLTVQVYYDAHYYWCRKGHGCKS